MLSLYDVEVQVAAVTILGREGTAVCDWFSDLAGMKSEPGDENGTKKEDSNDSEDDAENTFFNGPFFCCGKPSRRILALFSTICFLWISFASFSLLCILVSDDGQLTRHYLLPPRLLWPFFSTIVAFLVWKISSAAGNKTAARLDAVYRWRAAWLAQWSLGHIFLHILMAVFVQAFEPFYHPAMCHTIPGLCHMNKKLHHNVLWARITSLTIRGLQYGGLGTLYMAFLTMKVASGTRCLIFLYAVIRGIFCRYLASPFRQRVIQPFWGIIFRPQVRHAPANQPSEAVGSGFRTALVGLFPGPGSRGKPLLGEPESYPPLFYLLCAVAFLLWAPFTTTARSASAIGSSYQRENTGGHFQPVALYSMMLWLAWRLAALLNFSPATRFGVMAYNSRVGRFSQVLVGSFWQYNMWEIAGTLADVFEDYAYALSDSLENLAIFDALPAAGVYFGLFGFGIVTAIRLCIFLGIAVVAMYLGRVQLACLGNVGQLSESVAEVGPARSVDSSLEKGILSKTTFSK
ncbi:hypothetical protein NLG97_g3585 [Lecanicillium saksenae]|uniref:Uncharacterized protein n=1 Tax=Lecanicillium saksenae TaxID=468837 RepID=A0ACC1R1N2_9HYPO|nr:hypothetical protein NLG97_g3585 [Lecanicillium saksenae]